MSLLKSVLGIDFNSKKEDARLEERVAKLEKQLAFALEEIEKQKEKANQLTMKLAFMSTKRRPEPAQGVTG